MIWKFEGYSTILELDVPEDAIVTLVWPVLEDAS